MDNWRPYVVSSSILFGSVSTHFGYCYNYLCVLLGWLTKLCLIIDAFRSNSLIQTGWSYTFKKLVSEHTAYAERGDVVKHISNQCDIVSRLLEVVFMPEPLKGSMHHLIHNEARSVVLGNPACQVLPHAQTLCSPRYRFSQLN